MTTAKNATPAKNANATNAHKSRSPAKDKRASAPDSDTPAKSAKKRRKVNHGMLFMLCTQKRLDSPANMTLASSVHLLQTFGKLLPPAVNTLPYAASETYGNDDVLTYVVQHMTCDLVSGSVCCPHHLG